MTPRLVSVMVGSAEGTGIETGGDIHRLIGELQPLDMGEVVGAVAGVAILSTTVTTSSAKSVGVPPLLIVTV